MNGGRTEGGIGQRLDALTGLRYLAALSVLVAHMSGNLPWPRMAPYLSTLSGLGMPLFFVLSGFLMAYNYSRDFQSRYGRTLRTYYVARVARIYPVYAITILLYFSFVGNFFHDLKNRPADTYKSLAYVGTLTQSWVHIPVFTDYMHPRTVTQAYVGVAWSVSVEVFFYLLFPLVALPVARFTTGRGRLLAGCGLVFAGYLAADYWVTRSLPAAEFAGGNFNMGRARWLLYLSPYARFGEFLIGAMVGQYFLVGRDRRPGNWWAGAGLLGGAAVALVWANFWFHLPPGGGTKGWLATLVAPSAAHPQWLKMAVGNVLYAPLCAVIIYQLAATPSLARRAIGCRLMVLLGEMSYCLYLLHPLAQSFYYQRSAGEGPLTNRYIVTYNNLAMVVVLHFLCLGVYKYAEVPARGWLRRTLDPRPVPAPLVLHVPADEPAVRRAA